MKTIEQIALEVAQEMGLIANSVYEAFAKQFLAAYLEQQAPIGWGVFYFGGKMNGRLYSQCDTKEQAERYISDRHQSDDTNTFRCAPLFLAPPPAVPEGYVLVPKEPSEEMCAEGCLKVGALYGHHGARSMYQAMIAAAQGEQE